MFRVFFCRTQRTTTNGPEICCCALRAWNWGLFRCVKFTQTSGLFGLFSNFDNVEYNLFSGGRARRQWWEKGTAAMMRKGHGNHWREKLGFWRALRQSVVAVVKYQGWFVNTLASRSNSFSSFLHALTDLWTSSGSGSSSSECSSSSGTPAAATVGSLCCNDSPEVCKQRGTF